MNILLIRGVFVLSLLLVASSGWYKYYEAEDNYLSTEHLSANTTYTLVSSLVWYHSRGKLQELRAIMLEGDLQKSKKSVKLKIENMLKHRTSVYIRQMNQYSTPIKMLGDWYAKTFAFPPFLKEIYEIVFRPITSAHRKYEIETKIKEIGDIMEKYQNLANSKLKEQLTKGDNDVRPI